MKWKTALFLCLFSNLVIAQLSVSNNNYIFISTNEIATDTYVFVEDDVNLKNVNSYIYLRNNAQLLQGSGTTGNSGIGQLSVYQNGTTHNYAYNYWCSPVGNTDIDDATNRAFRSNNNFYDVTTAPITSSLATYTSGNNGTSSPLVISNRWIYSYNPGVSSSEWDYIGDTGTVTTGYGFTMKGTSGSSNNQLYDFRGKPNNGTILTNVIDKEWTLVGNPYPSALDALDFIHDSHNTTTITGVLYFWEQDLSVTSHNLTDYVGGYASYTISSDGILETFIPATFDTYNNNGSLNTAGSSSASGKAVKRFIPIGQGFMVEGIANNTVRSTNFHREYYKQTSSQSQFFGPVDLSEDLTPNAQSSTYQIEYNDNGLQILPNDYKRFRLNVDFNDTFTRQIIQNFHNSATYGFDYGLEAKSPEGVSSDAYWVYEDEAYVAQAFSFNENLKIPLVINTSTQQIIRFRAFDIQNFDTNQTIYLHDLEKNIFTDLTVQSYEVNLESGKYLNRFEITFTNETLNTVESEVDEFDVFQNNNTSRLTLLNPNNIKVQEVSLFDINGKKIFHHLGLSLKTKHEFSTRNLSDGVYLVTIKTDKAPINKKVVISNK